jgi:two-component system NtrC family response regulator
MKPKLLIVDDDEEIRSQMRWALCAEYEIFLAEDRPAALEMCRTHQPMVVLLDLGLPPAPATPEEGLAALSEILALDSLCKVLIITGQGEKKNALEAIGRGAYDCLTKPVQVDEVKIVVRRAFHVATLEREFREIQNGDGGAFEGMLGSSVQMQSVFASIRKVSGTDAPVLILGESGTGKEMVARAIHRLSPRKDGPFVAINCGAIPENLLESELFGHEKGAFTGAHMQRKGRVEMAEDGTLFLDEVGELPLLLQVKLLRFLQEQRIERVGGRQEIPVDTRVIAATNIQLTEAMTNGAFREDLYYRLAVVVVKLPPLRERDGDIEVLARDFLRKCAAQTGKSGLSFEKEALRALMNCAWPGNVRELHNRIHRAVIMAEGKRITMQDLELTGGSGQPATPLSLKDARESVEREMIQKVLRKHGGKIAPSAAELGISRPTFYELMEKLGMKRDSQS